MKEIIESLSSLSREELLALSAALLKEFFLPQWMEIKDQIIKSLKQLKEEE